MSVWLLVVSVFLFYFLFFREKVKILVCKYRKFVLKYEMKEKYKINVRKSNYCLCFLRKFLIIFGNGSYNKVLYFL